ENLFGAATQSSEISGDISEIKYKQFVNDTLRESKLENFDINLAPGAFFLSRGAEKIAVSRWISPKRTRSYPYERVYDTLAYDGKKAVIIPVVKDEGLGGERDFLQWDTFSLMNLLEVYVVLGYYDQATKSLRKADSLVAQQYNREFVAAKLKELSQSNLSAVEWNLRELKNLKQTIEKARAAYQKISEETGVRLHNPQGLETFERKLSGDILQFLEFSRQKSQKAQTREFLTDQPNETLTTRTKSRITISDYLGGKYFYTVDEAVFENGTLYLIESKHNQGGKLTGTGDIKEGLVKMIVYRNMVDVRRNGKPVKSMPVLRLTASQMQGSISSEAKPEDLAKFIELNRFDRKQAELLQNLFKEAKQNDFLIRLEQADTKK
ncbi:MAG TPA: hypothetical protein VEX64_09090, partial [Pyrinomonadaceae bacterium]|nr:hypothetical protein [Pyrinomonadaceae bacterium]